MSPLRLAVVKNRTIHADGAQKCLTSSPPGGGRDRGCSWAEAWDVFGVLLFGVRGKARVAGYDERVDGALPLAR